MNTLERVSKAIYAATPIYRISEGHVLPRLISWEELAAEEPNFRKDMMDRALAAVEAMWEPSDAVCAAIYDARESAMPPMATSRELWTAGIDAILAGA